MLGAKSGLLFCGILPRFSPRHEGIAVEIDGDHAFGWEVAGDDFSRGEGFDIRLNKALEGARAVDWVICGVYDIVLRAVGDYDADAGLGESFAKRCEAEVYYGCDIFLCERLEVDYLVKAVEELGTEGSREKRIDGGSCRA